MAAHPAGDQRLPAARRRDPELPAGPGRPAPGRRARGLRPGLAGGGGVRRRSALPGAPAPHLADAAGADRRSAGRRGSPARTGRRPCGSARPRRSRCSGPACAATAGIRRVVASTHGHEVGWSMLPRRPAGPAPDRTRHRRRHGRLPLHPRPGRRRVRAGRRAGAPAARASTPTGSGPIRGARAALRRRYGLGDAPVVTCVSRLVARKGQDVLIARAAAAAGAGAGHAAPARRRRTRTRARLRGLAAAHGRRRARRVHRARSPAAELPAHHAVGDVFALPCRTRGGGLDVEGLGIVAAGGVGVGAAGGRGRLRRRTRDRAGGADRARRRRPRHRRARRRARRAARRPGRAPRAMGAAGRDVDAGGVGGGPSRVGPAVARCWHAAAPTASRLRASGGLCCGPRRCPRCRRRTCRRRPPA